MCIVYKHDLRNLEALKEEIYTEIHRIHREKLEQFLVSLGATDNNGNQKLNKCNFSMSHSKYIGKKMFVTKIILFLFAF